GGLGLFRAAVPGPEVSAAEARPPLRRTTERSPFVRPGEGNGCPSPMSRRRLRGGLAARRLRSADPPAGAREFPERSDAMLDAARAGGSRTRPRASTRA